ncbi:phasin family protein [Microvirga subterranea]|uniref:Phasin protein n=1 Tax=Microvirga subterranea TaxID=186651 RepID=A0A370HI00_9HYPH|nr:phasin protein [Microvirga subterranea]
MAEAKKARARVTGASAKGARKSAPAAKTETATEQLAMTEFAPQPVLQPEAPAAEAPQALQRVRTDALRKVMSEAVNATARGALEVHDKIIEALQAQSDAAIEVWESSLKAPHLSEAIRVQTNGARKAYETASAQWTDIATTTASWFHKSFEPFQTALHRQDR